MSTVPPLNGKSVPAAWSSIASSTPRSSRMSPPATSVQAWLRVVARRLPLGDLERRGERPVRQRLDPVDAEQRVGAPAERPDVRPDLVRAQEPEVVASGGSGAPQRVARGDGLQPVAERVAVQAERRQDPVGIGLHEHDARERSAAARRWRGRPPPLTALVADRKSTTGTIATSRPPGPRRAATPTGRRTATPTGSRRCRRRTVTPPRTASARPRTARAPPRRRSAPPTGVPPEPNANTPAPMTSTARGEDADERGRDQPRRPLALGLHRMGPVPRTVASSRIEPGVADAHRGSVPDGCPVERRRRERATPRPGGRTGREKKREMMADPTGFEPAISSVTGWHVGPLHHGSSAGGG